MQTQPSIHPVTLARYVGWSILGTIVVGMATAFFVAKGIDINMTADVEATARNMLEAETRLKAKAYLALLGFGLELMISLGLFLLLEKHGRLLASWSALVGIGASLIIAMGAVYTMNASELAGDAAYRVLTDESQQRMLAGLQATSAYTSFHLGLVLASLAKAGFFYLFLISRRMPRIISGWGLFASLLVAFMIVARDFIPQLANNTLTVAFIAANFIALLTTGLYLGTVGVRRGR